MPVILNSLSWAGALCVMALANRFGLIGDGSAATVFAVMPALWIATGGLGRCRTAPGTAA